MEYSRQTTRNIYIAAIGIVLVFVVYTLSTSISHHGKTKIDVTVVPRNAQLTINGVPKKSGSVYLKPGKYTFKAGLKGFSDDSRSITVGKSSQEIGLIPAPNSNEALTLLSEHPEISRAREAIGAQRVKDDTGRAISITPLIDQLPYSDIDGPFTIDYGPSQSRPGGSIILIDNASSSEGRTNALKWIRQQGYDPSQLEIRFGDYSSPILNEQGAN